MRNFSKLLVVALVFTLLASLLAVNSSAAATDPRTLAPGSENVVFVMDPAEDGTLPGDGSGTSPENPLKAIDHELFDPESEAPRHYYQTALYQATEILQETGGTVVLVGSVHIGPGKIYGNAATTQEFYTAQFKTNTIKFTSVWNGVDYRETNGAKLIVEFPAMIGIHGQSIWENIDIATNGTQRLIAFNHWTTRVGEGVNCYPTDELYEGLASNYISISAGHRFTGGADKQENLLVQSGTYNKIVGGIWGVNNKVTDTYTNNLEGASMINLTIEGTTTVLGAISGTVHQQSEFSGTVNVTINGGTFKCDIYTVGPTGVMNRDSVAVLKINGGDFKEAWTMEPVISGYINNAPAGRLLDFSGWTGDKEGLAAAYKLASEAATGFTNIKFPEGVTAEELASLSGATTPPPAVETTAPTNDTTAPINNNNNGPLVIGGDDTEENVAVGDAGNSNLGLIIGMGVGGFVIIAVLVVVIVIMSKKMKAK
ncbi:MAG: hypothetical protein IKU45_05275, partial [Clostridia bacterium]|nr:hypothetical protein [Clostridia bacterium]